MLGIRDDGGEERNSKARQDLSRGPDLRERRSSKFTKCTRAYFYPLLKTRRGWIHLPAHIWESEKTISSRRLSL